MELWIKCKVIWHCSEGLIENGEGHIGKGKERINSTYFMRFSL